MFIVCLINSQPNRCTGLYFIPCVYLALCTFFNVSIRSFDKLDNQLTVINGLDISSM